MKKILLLLALLTALCQVYSQYYDLIVRSNGDPLLLPMIRTGYRYQGPQGFLFRCGIYITFSWDLPVLPTLQIGYSF
ncbi:MAG: hypothetical protein JSV22_08775 [Bacteroidales bacterium]|nr:MAG: hypothetical protein JSV22_08775 [Bacteroidales bacterium]